MSSSGSRTGSETPSLDTYTRAAEAAAAVVIRSYSTSFGLATRLLPSRQRRHVQNIYALVRVADEVVDGVAAEAGLDPVSTAASLDALENEVEAALGSGYSTDLIVHAFARTARATGFGVELSAPFFASMRADIVEVEHTPESFATYIYGSAEVVGLMCLAAFLEGRRVTVSKRDELQRGARALGAAFQKVNFLRDLAADFRTLGRSYFPDVRVDNFDEATKIRLLDDLDADLRVASSIIPGLPRGSRRAVAIAHGLFAELSRRIRAVPAERLIETRVSVPDPVKLRIVARALLTSGRLA
ncbi:phytoene/squalene synthase family protein [Naasia lichenicola]|uniref:Phytoene/squalene synthase family protein n=1 Tax=Naasia lichenicola TaxID=2565933 RepID=A0A4S4FJR9_9MICO|nr:squalene/phytoene synthase family protein [Naasia lichenicola]THG29505.1 phytoene/squalene synthase family protein [Naasia lichenicola]